MRLTESGLLIASQLRQWYSLSFWDNTIVATAFSITGLHTKTGLKPWPDFNYQT